MSRLLESPHIIGIKCEISAARFAYIEMMAKYRWYPKTIKRRTGHGAPASRCSPEKAGSIDPADILDHLLDVGALLLILAEEHEVVRPTSDDIDLRHGLRVIETPQTADRHLQKMQGLAQVFPFGHGLIVGRLGVTEIPDHPKNDGE
jgi:hypothetical protein